MRKLVSSLAVVALVGMVGGSAVAQEASSRPVTLRKVIVNFTEEVIEGHGTQPDLEAINVRHRTRFESLVKLRTNFRAELLRSANEL
ncbi:MAG: hypothetical protein JXR83_16825 [Deltaproteobacteria bacterium]|nr:hypothetical protein [Deltaproteobacteria bacterium]